MSLCFRLGYAKALGQTSPGSSLWFGFWLWRRLGFGFRFRGWLCSSWLGFWRGLRGWLGFGCWFGLWRRLGFGLRLWGSSWLGFGRSLSLCFRLGYAKALGQTSPGSSLWFGFWLWRRLGFGLRFRGWLCSSWLGFWRGLRGWLGFGCWFGLWRRLGFGLRLRGWLCSSWLGFGRSLSLCFRLGYAKALGQTSPGSSLWFGFWLWRRLGFGLRFRGWLCSSWLGFGRSLSLCFRLGYAKALGQTSPGSSLWFGFWLWRRLGFGLGFRGWLCSSWLGFGCWFWLWRRLGFGFRGWLWGSSWLGFWRGLRGWLWGSSWFWLGFWRVHYTLSNIVLPNVSCPQLGKNRLGCGRRRLLVSNGITGFGAIPLPHLWQKPQMVVLHHIVVYPDKRLPVQAERLYPAALPPAVRPLVNGQIGDVAHDV